MRSGRAHHGSPGQARPITSRISVFAYLEVNALPAQARSLANALLATRGVRGGAWRGGARCSGLEWSGVWRVRGEGEAVSTPSSLLSFHSHGPTTCKTEQWPHNDRLQLLFGRTKSLGPFTAPPQQLAGPAANNGKNRTMQPSSVVYQSVPSQPGGEWTRRLDRAEQPSSQARPRAAPRTAPPRPAPPPRPPGPPAAFLSLSLSPPHRAAPRFPPFFFVNKRWPSRSQGSAAAAARLPGKTRKSN